ncbi:MAG TPA: disulfide bond formation protein B [Burkholderiales bacterium]|nr:disulfide bond formation protein B [Burkholderiales bacterium]
MTPRRIYVAVFLACAGLMGYALYLQHVVHLEPCPLCIFQRYAFVVTGLIALTAAIHRSGRVSTWIYSALLMLSAGSGAIIAGRQSWLQHHPPNTLDCGPDLAYMLDSFPLAQVLPKVFKGEGDCAKAVWKFLGLSIPEWALVWFVLFIIAAALAIALRSRRRSQRLV